MTTPARKKRAYREGMGKRVQSLFAALPDPADHAVFRIEPTEPADRR